MWASPLIDSTVMWMIGAVFLSSIVTILFMIKSQKRHQEKLLQSISLQSQEALIKIIKENAELKENITKLSVTNTHDVLMEFRSFEQKLSETLNAQIEQLRHRIDVRLSEGFDKTRETFQSVMDRLTRIDEAQKQMEKMTLDVISIQDILSDKKARGIFGEVQLSQLLSVIFGENNTRVYEMQKRLSNGNTVDAVLYTPKPMGMLTIDSKFPLENYKRMLDQKIPEAERKDAQKRFITDVKKHIDAIESKYIITDETSDQAVMFVPAEAIFAEINAYYHELIEYAQKKRVWIASPTTLMASLTSIQVLLRNLERDKYSEIIQHELKKLAEEFTRYQLRWTKLKEQMDKMSQHVQDVHITSEKITKRFGTISRVEFEKHDSLNNEEVE